MEYEDESDELSRTSEERETQFFEFGRSFLKDSLKSMVEYNIQNKFNSVKGLLESTAFKDEESQKLALAKCADLANFTLDKSKNIVQSMCSDIDKYFVIPHNLVLPGDEQFLDDVTEEELEKLTSEVEAARLRSLRAASLQVILSQELCQAEGARSVVPAADWAGKTLENMKNYQISEGSVTQLVNLNDL